MVAPNKRVTPSLVPSCVDSVLLTARGTLTLECAPARASPNRDRRRIPSLADDDQLAVERFDDDGNTTGPGLAPVGYSLHALHFLTLFRNGKGLRVGLVRTAAHQFRAARGMARSCSFDHDGNNDRTGSLAARGLLLHAFTLLTLFQNRKAYASAL